MPVTSTTNYVQSWERRVPFVGALFIHSSGAFIKHIVFSLCALRAHSLARSPGTDMRSHSAFCSRTSSRTASPMQTCHAHTSRPLARRSSGSTTPRRRSAAVLAQASGCVLSLSSALPYTLQMWSWSTWTSGLRLSGRRE